MTIIIHYLIRCCKKNEKKTFQRNSTVSCDINFVIQLIKVLLNFDSLNESR